MLSFVVYCTELSFAAGRAQLRRGPSSMDAWLLCNAFLEYDAVIALFATCRTAARSPMLHPHITAERAAEFNEKRRLAAEDLDAADQSSEAGSFISVGFSIDSDGHWHEHSRTGWSDSD